MVGIILAAALVVAPSPSPSAAACVPSGNPAIGQISACPQHASPPPDTVQVGVSPPPDVRLPAPTHTCAQVFRETGARKLRINAENFGKLYAAALRLNGVRGHNAIRIAQLVGAYSDFLGCFVPRK